MKKTILITLMLSLILLVPTISAASDTYAVRWILPSNETVSNIAYISPSVDDEVPHIILGEVLNFKHILTLIKWQTIIWLPL